MRRASDIGHAIRQERSARGITQGQFAAEMGVSRKWLSEIENGKETAEVGLVLAVFRRLGFDLVAASRPQPEFDIDAALQSLTEQ